MEETINKVKFWWKNIKGRDHWGDLGNDERLLLK
jgi:hypothetical protein